MPGRVVSRRFIGREPELARFGAAVTAAASGTATAIMVTAMRTIIMTTVTKPRPGATRTVRSRGN